MSSDLSENFAYQLSDSATGMPLAQFFRAAVPTLCRAAFAETACYHDDLVAAVTYAMPCGSADGTLLAVWRSRDSDELAEALPGQIGGRCAEIALHLLEWRPHDGSRLELATAPMENIRQCDDDD